MKTKLLLLLQDIQKLLQQEWRGVQQSLQMSRNTAEILLNTWCTGKHIKFVELDELYIPYYVPLFCIMCHFVKNE